MELTCQRLTPFINSHSLYCQGLADVQRRLSISTGSTSVVSPIPNIQQKSQHCCCKKGDHYSLEETRYGLVAIINNYTEQFSANYRQGTIEDEERIMKFFMTGEFKSRYRVIPPFRNLDKDQFKATLKSLEERLHTENYMINSFFLFIMSHGSEGVVNTYRADGEHGCDANISIDDISNRYTDCLMGRPKVLIIQACQGQADSIETFDRVSPVPITPSMYDEYRGVRKNELCSPFSTTIPRAADMLIAQATVAGYRSYRGRMGSSSGSWFIRQLMQVLMESHVKEKGCIPHIFDVLTEVHLRVSQLKGHRKGECSQQVVKQMPCLQSTLRMNFYLLPPELFYTSSST